MYKLIKNPENQVTTILLIATNAFIPMNVANTDYQQYLAWLAEGNTPQPADG